MVVAPSVLDVRQDILPSGNLLDEILRSVDHELEARLSRLSPGGALSLGDGGADQPCVVLLEDAFHFELQYRCARPLVAAPVWRLGLAAQWEPVAPGERLRPGLVLRWAHQVIRLPLSAQEVGRLPDRCCSPFATYGIVGSAESRVVLQGPSGRFALLSHRGHFDGRGHNEDGAVAVVRAGLDSVPGSTLLAVGDGLGGEGAGELASSVVLQTLAYEWCQEVDLAEILTFGAVKALARAHDEVQRRQAALRSLRTLTEEADTFNMGTCIVAAEIRREIGTRPYDEARIVHVGDCLGMVVPRSGKKPYFDTSAHTFLNEIARKRGLSPEDFDSSPFRHVVSRCVKLADGEPIPLRDRRPDSTTVQVQRGDYIVLASDGMVVSPNRICDIVRRYREPEMIVTALNSATREILLSENREEEDDNVSCAVYLHE